MNFSFQINLSEEDYLAYNKFVLLKSHYGKKQMLRYRIVLAAIMVFILMISFFGGESSVKEKLIGIIPTLFIFTAIEFCLSFFFSFAIKQTVKAQKKAGKLSYSASSLLEFGEDTFTETTDEGKTERPYSAIERISVLSTKDVYIHINGSLAYILPKSVFSSDGQYGEFLDFIETKCRTVDQY